MLGTSEEYNSTEAGQLQLIRCLALVSLKHLWSCSMHLWKARIYLALLDLAVYSNNMLGWTTLNRRPAYYYQIDPHYFLSIFTIASCIFAQDHNSPPTIT